MKKIISVFLCIVVVFTCSILSGAKQADITGCNWMSVIDNNTSLADISMPGTHDTAACYVAFGIKARTQDKTIPEQLNCGARFFDIRLAADGNKLKLVHNFINCRKGSGFGAPKLYFDDVIGYCLDFLKSNPAESIVMFVKRDFGSAKGFEEKLLAYIAQNPESWYTQNRVPNLGEVRGKLVLMNRFSDNTAFINNENGGVNLSNFPSQGKNEGSFAFVSMDAFGGSMISTYTIQDRFNYPKEDKWEKAILPTLELEKAEGGLLINFLSTAAGVSPEINARYINNLLLNTDLNPSKCYGAVLFDFIDEALAAKIYSCNAAITNASAQPRTSVAIPVPEPQHGAIRFLDGLWSILINIFS